jgi:hypothetical protein
MDRLFLDANVLFSAAYKTNTALLQLSKLKDVALFSSRFALEEARINLTDEDQRVRLNQLSGALHVLEAGQKTVPLRNIAPRKGFTDPAGCRRSSRHSPVDG